MTIKSMRAQPLPLDDRRASIVNAVIPLLLAHGRAVTSKQIADAAGIAEGTIFRAFGNKETLIRAAVDRFLDVEPLRRELRAIDVSLPLEAKIRTILEIVQRRFTGVFGMMAILGEHERPASSRANPEYQSIIATILEPDQSRLIWPAERIGHIIRLIAFSSALPQFHDGTEFSLDDLSSIILFGIAGTPQRQGN